MKYLSSFLLLTLLSCGISVNRASNTTKMENLLKQHSYLVFHNSEQRNAFGTGFFIKQNKQLYFITANHVAAFPVDSMNILIDNEMNNVITISLANGHGKELKSNFGEYDLYIKQMSEDLSSKINTINKFMPDFKKFDFSKIKKIVYFGFPQTTEQQQYDFKSHFPTLVKSEDTIIGSYNYIRYSSKFNKYDSINYMTKSNNGTYSGEGDSGAPVFFKVKNKYFFGGMCVAGVKSLQLAYILRPDKIIDSLHKFSK